MTKSLKDIIKEKPYLVGIAIILIFFIIVLIAQNPGMDFIHQIEIFMIAAIIFYQAIFSFNLGREIEDLKQVFKDPPQTQQLELNKNPQEIPDIPAFLEGKYRNEIYETLNGYKVTLLTTPRNPTSRRISDAINSYLMKNYGASTNFSIVKDIIDREINNKDEGINNSISMPLYLGLAATMLGIIFGLFSIDLSKLGESAGTLGDTHFIQNISSLITGVKIAIIASLFGIVFTTILSVFWYKPAKNKVEEDKNEFISYLQAELLPELQKNDDQSIAALNRSLDEFSRRAVGLNQSINNSVEQLTENIQKEHQLVEQINKMDLQQVSKYNLQVADKLNPTLQQINQLSEKLTSLNQSIETMERLSQQLSYFVSRTDQMEEIYNEINRNLNESRTVINFLDTHLEEIKNSGDEANKAVSYAHASFKEAIDELKNKIDESFQQINNNATTVDSHLREKFSEVNQNLHTIANDYIQNFERQFSDSVPRLENLNRLGELVNMGGEITEHVRHTSTQEMQQIKGELRNINQALQNNHQPTANDNNQPGDRGNQRRKVQFILQVAAYGSLIAAAATYVIYMLN